MSGGTGAPGAFAVAWKEPVKQSNSPAKRDEKEKPVPVAVADASLVTRVNGLIGEASSVNVTVPETGAGTGTVGRVEATPGTPGPHAIVPV